MKRIVCSGIMVFLFSLLFVTTTFAGIEGADKGWQAGVAREKITPGEPMWMAGYAKRTHPAEGKIHDLWVKALAIKDASGKWAVLVSSDLLGFPRYLSDRIFHAVKLKYGLSRSQLVLNSSHTHSGPVIVESLADCYPLDSIQKKKVIDYSAELEDKIVATIGKAIKSLKPAQIYSGVGVSRIQVNRMFNSESDIMGLDELRGPNNFSVPVLKVVGANRKLMAIVFSYACHATVLDGYQWSGDYPGFAQLELEKEHRGTVAMFFQGAGADQNPLPRRSVALARQYGGELACSVERVLEEEMTPLEPVLKAAYSEVELPFKDYPTEEELVQMVNELDSYQQRWAKRMLTIYRNDEPIMESYPLPLQALKLGNQLLLTMGGEPVIGYTNKFKKLFGQNTIVYGYSNDVMGYIPTAAVLEHGGYEGKSSQIAWGLPAAWNSNVEDLVVEAMTSLVKQIKSSDTK
uniref:neutral/alkaline non-lysosomal ceramidase N-terminal domain-containing protein n=1 Tax=uncultured Draconibacterium sp. TaxID=1573823 RepID=UPI003216816F